MEYTTFFNNLTVSPTPPPKRALLFHQKQAAPVVASCSILWMCCPPVDEDIRKILHNKMCLFSNCRYTG